MRLNKKKLLLAFVCLVSIVLAYWTASVIAETYFFDKFFYFKSIEHGYWGVEQKFSRESFGERASDLIQLDKDFSVINSGERVLGVSSDEIYTIALIGDSYVWGQGVRFEDTVSQLLEKKLNQYKNTTVLSLGDSGDSILDFLMRYDRAKQTYPIDLYIFVLVQNDFLLKEDYKEKYKQMLVFRGCQDLFPEQEPVYDLSNNWTEIIIDDPEAYQEKLQEKYDQSLRSKLNLCILDHSLQALPTDNAIFLSPHIIMRRIQTYHGQPIKNT